MHWYIKVLTKYAVFSGRARRKEYWWFFLFNVIITFAIILLGGAFDPSGDLAGGLYGFYTLAVIIPSLAVSVRRLHDTNHSGWWLLLPVVPIIGALVLIVFFAQDSQPDENDYGPNPKTAYSVTA